ncbi:hypothetical protein I302_102553 [Kwoniella bestiolae CBS 10118]|uniref:Uncharacterized protein n=1 Tax=Kwoniella bestiolae CBS 10118 TaxID=1296100 RepID=A0A1B9GFE5_9TREE|nr:hypothetical protein I302_01239 [Kwoniella bestiolae CBS 10118]OCF29726.1 hypothetical protein I302_01239 [Kwoniella bestiolae CBS 10118]
MSRQHSSSNHHSSNHHRSHSRPHRDYYKTSYDKYRKGCNPLICCKCSFGGKRVQSFLLILVPFVIAIICFLAGFWLIPVWVYDAGYGGRTKIAAQGYGVNGEDSGTRQFLYPTTSWPSPMNGFPLLLLFHLIISILIVAYLLLILSIVAFASRRRRSETWYDIVRDSKWWERGLCILVTLVSGIVLVLDNVVWGLARSKGHNLNPDVLGYFVNIVALLLWVFWVILQCASTHDINEYYVSGGGRVRVR